MAGWDELTARENATLAAVERRLTNAEIAAEFHISVRTVESHIAALRRKLGVDSRAALITAARARRGTAVQVPQNSFVGRDTDLAAVRTLLDRERWVTVVGAAGSGKTRLVLELAAADRRIPVVAALEHAGPADVVTAVARAIGIGPADDLLGACAVALEAQPYLLVLDNCDRVAGAVAALVGALLPVAGSLTVLATSRAPAGGSDEAVYPLLPLALNDAAGRLFTDRATSAAPGFVADPALVGRICARLDGLPLAIELAAARVRHLPLDDLAARLDDGFGALDRSGPDGRHRTLAAAFAWTWDLLDGAEQSVLSRLAALPRTFDLALAGAVAGTGADAVVLRLLDRSLLAPAGRPGRFRLLAPLRAFVLDRTPADVAARVRDAHAEYHAALSGRLAARARTDDSRAMADLAAELCSEVGAAIDWALEHRPDLALPMTVALAVGSEQYGPQPNSLDVIARAAPALLAVATPEELLPIGSILCYNDLDLAWRLAERALAGSDGLAALHLAGYVASYRHADEALDYLARAEKLATAAGDDWQLASVRQMRGVALRRSDPPGAIAALSSALDGYARSGDAMHVNNVRYMMAFTAGEAGVRTDEARGWAEECVAYTRDAGNRHEIGHALLAQAPFDPSVDLLDLAETFRAAGDLRCLTRTYLRLADRDGGVDQLRAALEVARRAKDTGLQAIALERLVHTYWTAGAFRAAARSYGELSTVVDEPAAPDGLLAEQDRWAAAIAEGRAVRP